MEKLIKQNVGIDVSKDTFATCFTVHTDEHKKKIKASRKFSNTIDGFKALTQWVETKRDKSIPVEYTMEATGVYYENLAYYLDDLNEIVHIIIPSRAKRYATSFKEKSKTDKIDAKMLGYMGLERELERWKPSSPMFKVLKGITRERSSLIKYRTMLKNQRHALNASALPHKKSLTRIGQMIRMINKQILDIEKEIENIVDQDLELKKKLLQVQSIPGVGFSTAVIIVAETDGFALIKSIKQLVSYAGLDVKIRVSGKWKGRSKISKRGNVHIRKALYFPALSSSNHCITHKLFYNRLLENKQIPMVASVAVQRKLLGLIYTLWKNDTTYIENYQQKRAA